MEIDSEKGISSLLSSPVIGDIRVPGITDSAASCSPDPLYFHKKEPHHGMRFFHGKLNLQIPGAAGFRCPEEAAGEAGWNRFRLQREPAFRLRRPAHRWSDI